MNDNYSFTIQKYDSKDKENIEKIIHDLILESKELGWEHFGDFNDFEKYIDNPRNITLVSKVDDYIVGFILGYPQMYDNSLAICINYVDKQYRRRGIGSKLKEELVKEATRLGYDYIQSDVDACNIASVKMNLKANWDIEYFPDYKMYEFKKRLK